jgi:hypothetical membrane protein
MNQDYVTRWLTLCGIIAPLQIVVFILIAGALTPGYSHLSDTISQLGALGQPQPLVIGLGLVLYGLLVNAAALGLYRLSPPSAAAKLTLVALCAHGASVLLAGVFRDQPWGPGVHVTVGGTLHGYLALIAFGTLAVGIFAFARAVHGSREWGNFSLVSTLAGVLALAFSLLFLVESLYHVQGMVQRLFYLFPVVWMELVFVHAFNLASHHETAPMLDGMGSLSSASAQAEGERVRG